MSETDTNTNLDTCDCDGCALAEHQDHHERAYRRVRRVRRLHTAMEAGALALTGAGVLTGTSAYVYGALAVVTILLGWHVLDRRHDTPQRREVTIARAQYARTAPPPESVEDGITVSGIPALWPIPIGGKTWHDLHLMPRGFRLHTGHRVENWLLYPLFLAGAVLLCWPLAEPLLTNLTGTLPTA